MDSQWLKTQFAMHPDKNKTDLARALGLEASAISKILSGTRQIKAAEYVIMRRFFGMPVDGDRAAAARPHDRLYAANAAADDSYVLAPLGHGMQDTGSGPDRADAESWVMPASLFAHRTSAPPDQIKIFTIQENAMLPDFQSGEQVLVDLSARLPSPPGVFIVSDGLGHIIRQCAYMPHSEPPAIRLSALNDQYEAYTVPLDRTDIIGRVIAKLQWL